MTDPSFKSKVFSNFHSVTLHLFMQSNVEYFNKLQRR